jgi:hypothetical protein
MTKPEQNRTKLHSRGPILANHALIGCIPTQVQAPSHQLVPVASAHFGLKHDGLGGGC